MSPQSQYPFNLPITCIECGERIADDEVAVMQPRQLDVTGPIYAIVIHERCETRHAAAQERL